MAKKRITAKQKAARRKNIAVARKHRKKGRGPASKKAGKAYAKEYKKQKKDKYISKAYARRKAHAAAIKANPTAGKRIARRYAMGVARRQGIKTKTGQRQFASGYLRSLR